MPRLRPSFATVRQDPDFGRAVRIAEYDRPNAPDEVETAQTIAYMDELAARDAGDASVIRATHEAMRDAGISIAAGALDKTAAVFAWLKRNIRYETTPGTSRFVDQTLIPPATFLTMPEPHGDCPQYSMLASAMLRVCCVQTRFKTIAQPDNPRNFSHVYNVAEIRPGVYIPFDSSNGPELGAEYAFATKARVWPPQRPVRCKGARYMIQSGSAPAGVRNSTLKGMGAWSDVFQTAIDDASRILTPIFAPQPGSRPPAAGNVPGYTPATPAASINPTYLYLGAGLVALLALSKK